MDELHLTVQRHAMEIFVGILLITFGFAIKGFIHWKHEMEDAWKRRVQRKYEKLNYRKPTMFLLSSRGGTQEQKETLLTRQLQEWERDQEKARKMKNRYRSYGSAVFGDSQETIAKTSTLDESELG